MADLRNFNRAVRKELARISLSIKMIEFKTARLHGFLKRHFKPEVLELKRKKDYIQQRLAAIKKEKQHPTGMMEAIHEDILYLQERCRQLKTQL